MTERSFLEVLRELDTITDLVDYMSAKEALLANCSVVVEGSEANLVGLYLSQNRTFPRSVDFLIADDTIWRGLREEQVFKQRKQADKDSYVWDTLIEWLSDLKAKAISGPGPSMEELEMALRAVARESRLARRVLGKALKEFLTQTDQIRSRALISPSRIIYVFVWYGPQEEPKHRTAELGCRCMAARRKIGKGDTIVGIGLSPRPVTNQHPLFAKSVFKIADELSRGIDSRRRSAFRRMQIIDLKDRNSFVALRNHGLNIAGLISRRRMIRVSKRRTRHQEIA